MAGKTTTKREGIVTSNPQIDAPTESPSNPQARAAATSASPAVAADLSQVPGSFPASPSLVERARNERDETPRASEQRPSPWRRNYATRLWISDLFVLIWAVYGTQLLWFGWGNAQVAIREDSRFNEFSYWAFSAILVAAWMWALALIDSRDHRIIGAGTTEYVRVARASFTFFGTIAILAFLFRVDVARGYLLITLPLGIFVLLLERWLWRQWLIAQRWIGQYSAKVLLVGSADSVAAIARELHRSPTAGYRVVGACVPSGKIADTVPGTSVPVMGSVDNIERAIAATGADTVAVTSTDDLPPMKVKQISWALESGRQHLVLAPSIVDIAGPRIHTRPVAGLPLIHVETPKFSRGQRIAKRTMDLVMSVAGVVLVSPLLAFLAISVRLTSEGPVLFRQKRIGLKGREFEMLKFRSMVVNAEELLADLRAKQNSGNEVLFKMADDPRVTPIGKIMRKYSLDELPQLFNVLAGNMSLVGPRPPLASEVERYDTHVHRRFLMKPGITGAWQVGGRSSLSWEDSVRLDLGYVENWSLVGDLVILAKTTKAAFAPGYSAH
ncbi:exopolysaccharide biosynthesis polyprenyl glycosylphosphotransferase [Microbacterium trichothecenolyticum]|uniref:sugar transferase n=1 Tax=Microbacterium trichothecenolyticum TaxID=69370 RepID=UPI0028579C3B|nr:sugar transferase [Microbacterium trichothecenolyticum]MDR7184917.1 exopolysaccharide biosynthesis polyprenyl glycosylphosphotransferase [Microbacterium trichothecenolyticum]